MISALTGEVMMLEQQPAIIEVIGVTQIMATEVVAVDRVSGWFRFVLAAPASTVNGQPSNDHAVVAWVMMPEEAIEEAIAKATSAMLRRPIELKHG